MPMSMKLLLLLMPTLDKYQCIPFETLLKSMLLGLEPWFKIHYIEDNLTRLPATDIYQVVYYGESVGI